MHCKVKSEKSVHDKDANLAKGKYDFKGVKNETICNGYR